MKCSNCGNIFEGKFCPACGTPAGNTSPTHHICQKCGNEYDGNFCPACGAPASDAGANGTPLSPPPRGKKKSGCLTVALSCVGVLVFLCIIGAIFGDTESTDATSKSQDVISTTAPTEAPAETVVPQITESPTPAPTADAPVADSDTTLEDSDLTLSMDVAGPLLESIISQNFDEDKYTLEYDDTGITLSLWEDGLSLGAVLAASGNEDAKTAWDEMKDNLIYMSDSISDALETLGIENTVITINILNEQNPDNTLLCIMNGVVIYDSTEE